jgi:hypothetical protein
LLILAGFQGNFLERNHVCIATHKHLNYQGKPVFPLIFVVLQVEGKYSHSWEIPSEKFLKKQWFSALSILPCYNPNQEVKDAIYLETQ